MEKSCPSCLSRRTFLGISLGTATAGLLVSCGISPTAPTSSGSNGVFTFKFSDYPALKNAGGSAHVSIKAASGTKDVYITRVSTSSVVTVSTVCTHLGCTIGGYDSGTGKYTCPCHGSVFNSDGSVSNGPASKALTTFSSTLTQEGVEVTAA